MFDQKLLSDLIQEKIQLSSGPGEWLSCKCEVCNDYKDRGAFKFDGTTVGYNCFNCSAKGRYEEGSGELTRSFRKILNAFGIENPELDAVINSGFFTDSPQKETISLSALTEVKTTTPSITFPDHFIALGSDVNLEYQFKLMDYLLSRHIDFERWKVFFSFEERLINRVIIPFYRNGRPIFWQARSIFKSDPKRYENSPGNRDAIMFNMDRLKDPGIVFVTEGIFDAMPINGVALCGSSLNEAKKILLLQSPAKLVFVVDKDQNGKLLATEAIKNGFAVTFTPGTSEDVNDSISRYGLSWTARQLVKGIISGRDAETTIALECR